MYFIEQQKKEAENLALKLDFKKLKAQAKEGVVANKIQRFRYLGGFYVCYVSAT
jgi:hypothetical protein